MGNFLFQQYRSNISHMPELTIIVNSSNQDILAELKEKGKIIDRMTIPYNLHLDSILIASVDKFLKKNNIEPESLNNVKVKGKSSPTSSSHRIVSTFVKALKS